jgi:hypothetical protein
MVSLNSWIRLAAATITVALAGWLTLSLDPGRPSAPSRERSPARPLVLNIADALGAVAAGHGDLWVDDRARERLVRVDGTDGRVLAAVPVRGGWP